MSEDFALLLGMLIAGGNLAKNHFSLTEKNDKVGDLYSKLCLNIFGIKPTMIVDSRNNVVYHQISSKPVSQALKTLIGLCAFNKMIPNSIMDGSHKEKLACLRGISLDGYYIRGRKKQVVYAGVSELLRDQITTLACDLYGSSNVYSFQKRINYKGNDMHGTCYGVRISCPLDMVEDHKNKEVSSLGDYVTIDGKQLTALDLDYRDKNYNSYINLKRRFKKSRC